MIKKLILLFYALFIFCSQAYTNLYTNLFDAHDKPTRALNQLLSILHIDHNGTIESIFEQTQSHWLRQAGKERWEIEEYLIEDRSELLELFDKLGMIQSIQPSKKEYDYAVLLGSTLHGIRERLAYLINLHKKGIKFNTLVILTGQRPLDQHIESTNDLLNPIVLHLKKNWVFNGIFPSTESEMILFVLEQTELPQEWEKIPIIFIDVPMKTEKRPTTEDTIREWLETNPKPGSILAISNQPYIGYQDATFRKCISKKFVVESVGPACSSHPKISIILDSLARCIYQEYHIRKN